MISLSFMAILALSSLAATARTPTAPPMIYLNHLYVVVDQATFDALAHSDYFLHRFAGVDSGVPEFGPIRPEAWSLYVRGQSCYVEILSPKNEWKQPVGKVGVGFGTEREGDIETVYTLFNARYGDKAHKNLTRLKSGAAWTHTVWADSPAQSDAFNVWFGEYDPSFLKTISPNTPAHEQTLRREDYLRPVYRPERDLQTVAGIELPLAPPQIEAWLPELAALGIAVRHNGEEATFKTPGVAWTLRPRPNGTASTLRLVLALNKPSRLCQQFGSSELDGKGKTAHWTFELPVVPAARKEAQP